MLRFIPACAVAGLLTLGIVTAPKAVAIHVSPQVLFVNGSLQITCTVEPDDRNRQLTAGLRFYTSSTRPLEGSHAPKQWVFARWTHVLCPETDDRYLAYCQVLRNDDSVIDAVATVLVSGCEF